MINEQIKKRRSEFRYLNNLQYGFLEKLLKTPWSEFQPTRRISSWMMKICAHDIRQKDYPIWYKVSKNTNLILSDESLRYSLNVTHRNILIKLRLGIEMCSIGILLHVPS